MFLNTPGLCIYSFHISIQIGIGFTSTRVGNYMENLLTIQSPRRLESGEYVLGNSLITYSVYFI